MNVGTGVPPVIRFSGTLAVPAGGVPVTFGLYAVLLGAAAALPTGLFASGEWNSLEYILLVS